LADAVIGFGPTPFAAVDFTTGSGAVTQQAAGAINTATLLSSGGIAGVVSLAVGGPANDFRLIDAASLTVTGPLTATRDVTLTATGTASITATGSISAGRTLAITSGSGGVALNTG